MNIVLDQLHVSLRNKQILQNITCTFSPGKMIGIIGPNGSGKSTLLKTLATIYPYDHGQIQLDHSSIKKFNRKQIAKTMCYVPQDTNVAVDFSVRQVVQMGRHIHHPLFARESAKDKEIIEEAMQQTNITHLQDQSIQQLSGGQRQLVMIAKALAQDTPIILLDEPIASLDVYYQLYILHMLHRLRLQNKTIIIVLHDLNLAARFCDELLLLQHGRVKQFGLTKDVLTPQLLEDVYHVDTHIMWNTFTSSVQVISEI